MTAQTLTEMRELLARHGIGPRTALGQHFLADPNITRRVVAASGIGQGDRALEIGAGTGTLTRALAAAGAAVRAYEIDDRLRPILEEATAGLSVDLRFEDATAVDWVAELGPGPWKLVSNLPYQVGTTILLDLLQTAPAVIELTAMVQLQVAQRLVAHPGQPAYGLPSVIVRLHARPRLLFRVLPHAFFPPPRVESAVVQMARTSASPLAGRAAELAAAGFGQRRKMLRRSLAALLADPVAALEDAGLDPTARAEQLSAQDYLRLAEVAP